MRKQLFFWELAGFLVTGALGSLLHFVYQWSGENQVAAAFSAGWAVSVVVYALSAAYYGFREKWGLEP